MSRWAADLQICREITAVLPEYAALNERLYRAHFLSKEDARIMQEVQRVMEAAVGRLALKPTLRIPAEAEEEIVT